jgi:hypothetical protein
MKLNYYIINGKIYDLQHNEITADEKGIVNLIVEDKPKRFVLAKLAVWMQNNSTLRPVGRPRKKRQQPAIKRPVGRPRTRVKKERVKEGRGRPKKIKEPHVRQRQNLGRTGVHRRKELIAITPDGKELQFESRAEAVRELKVCKSGIFKVLKNKIPNTKGYQFKTA